MAISKKKPPSISVDGMQRIVQQIYDDINDIINSVNQNEKDVRSLGKGKVGDIKVVKTSSKKHRLEAYTDEGWAGVLIDLIEKQVD